MTVRLAVTAAFLALAVTSCNLTVTTSPTLATTTTTAPVSPDTTISTAEAVALYGACLEQAGLNVGSIPLDARGRPRLDVVMSSADFSTPDHVEALAECAPHLMAGALTLADEPVLRGLLMANLADFSSCVRDHGVDGFPHPDPDFNGVGAPYPSSEIPYDDPDLVEAVETCRSRLGDQG